MSWLQLQANSASALYQQGDDSVPFQVACSAVTPRRCQGTGAGGKFVGTTYLDFGGRAERAQQKTVNGVVCPDCGDDIGVNRVCHGIGGHGGTDLRSVAALQEQRRPDSRPRGIET